MAIAFTLHRSNIKTRIFLTQETLAIQNISLQYEQRLAAELGDDPILAQQLIEANAAGNDWIERMMSLPSLEEYDLSIDRKRYNMAAQIFRTATGDLTNRGIGLTARKESIPLDSNMLHVAAQEAVVGCAGIDIRAGFYRPQEGIPPKQPKKPSNDFGRYPSILVYKRGRANNTRGSGTVKNWDLKGWIGFEPDGVMDIRDLDSEIVDDLGQSHIVLFKQSTEEGVPSQDSRSHKVTEAVDFTARAILKIIRAHINPEAAEAVQATIINLSPSLLRDELEIAS